MREEQPYVSQQVSDETSWLVCILLSIIAIALCLALIRGLVPTQHASSERRILPTTYHHSTFAQTDPIAVASARRPVAEELPVVDHVVVQSFPPPTRGHHAVAPTEPKGIFATHVSPMARRDSLAATALVAVVDDRQPIPTVLHPEVLDSPQPVVNDRQPIPTVVLPEVLDSLQPPSATPCQQAKTSILVSVVLATPIGHASPVKSACSWKFPSPTSTIAVFILAVIGSSTLCLGYSRKSGYDIHDSPRLYDKTLVATPAATKKVVDGDEDEDPLAITYPGSPVNLDCDVETPLTPVRTALPQPESSEASPLGTTFPSSDDTPVTAAPNPTLQNNDDDDTHTGFSALRVSDSLQLIRQKPRWDRPVFSGDIVSDNATYPSSASPENLSDEGTEKFEHQMVPRPPQFIKKDKANVDTPPLDNIDDIEFFDVGVANGMSTPKVAQTKRWGSYIVSRYPPSLTVPLQWRSSPL